MRGKDPFELCLLAVLALLVCLFLAAWAFAGDVYRFGPIRDSQKTYQDGTIVPHRHQIIERLRADDGMWEDIGYIEIHLHKVKKEPVDIEDVSAGVTVRINPKHIRLRLQE